MPKCNCNKEPEKSPAVLEIKNCDTPTLFHKVLVPAAMGDEETNPPQNGQYRNTLLVYEATGSAFLFSSDGIYTFLAERGPAGPPGKDGKDGADGFSPVATVTQTQTGATITITDKDGTTTATVYNGKDVERIIFYANNAETGVYRHLYKDNAFATAATAQDLLDATIAGAPSVRFISSSDPDNYNEAFIQNAFVNPDNHDFEFVFMDDRSTFNYSATTLTDAVFSYYKSDFQAKLTAGSNIQISGATISATDTTYSDFTGATPSVAGANGLVPAPTTSDPEKYLKGDGTWGTPTNTTYTAGTNVQISAQNVISATDTTYSAFTGTDGVSAGTTGLVPAPTTSDTNKYLKSDGTWATVSGGGGGTSRYDASWLMSQQVATQTQYDELRAAIAAGDIIYAGASNEILVATYYGAPVGSAFVYFSYDEIYSNNGSTSTTVVAMAFGVDGTTLAITPLGDTTTIPKSVPTKTSDLTNDGSDNTSVYVEADELATVATTGDYGDLLNKPTIPAAQVNSDWNANSGVAQILNKPTIPAAQIQSDWTQADNTQLDYIKNKPTIPVVNDATLTIQHNGTTKATFSSNSSVATTANIETIYADTVAPTATVGAITTANLADDAVTAAKIDWATVGDAIYPVGSIVTFYDTADHSNFLGLTWTRFGAGKMIVGYDSADADFDSIGETGGEKSHTLTATEMPSHNHGDLNWTTDTYHTSLDSGSSGNGIQLSYNATPIRYNQGDFRTGYTGGGGAHNNMPPYIVASLWRRTA